MKYDGIKLCGSNKFSKSIKRRLIFLECTLRPVNKRGKSEDRFPFLSIPIPSEPLRPRQLHTLLPTERVASYFIFTFFLASALQVGNRERTEVLPDPAAALFPGVFFAGRTTAGIREHNS